MNFNSVHFVVHFCWLLKSKIVTKCIIIKRRYTQDVQTEILYQFNIPLSYLFHYFSYICEMVMYLILHKLPINFLKKFGNRKKDVRKITSTKRITEKT